MSGEGESRALVVVAERIAELTRCPGGAAYAHVVSLCTGVEGFGARALVEFPVGEHVARTSYGTLYIIDSGAHRGGIDVGRILGRPCGYAQGGLAGPRVDLDVHAVVTGRDLCEVGECAARYGYVGSIEPGDVFRYAGFGKLDIDALFDSRGLIEADQECRGAE